MPKEGDLQVWIIPQIPGEAFLIDVNSIPEGKKILDALGDYQLFMLQNEVIPDYSNVGGIRRWEQDDWCDVDEDEEEDCPECGLVHHEHDCPPCKVLHRMHHQRLQEKKGKIGQLL